MAKEPTIFEKAKTARAEADKVTAEAIQELLTYRAEIDKQLAELGYTGNGGTSAAKKEPQQRAPKTCSTCHQTGHTARTCPNEKEVADKVIGKLVGES